MVLIKFPEHLEYLDLSIKHFIFHCGKQVLDMVVVNVFLVDVFWVDAGGQLLRWGVSPEPISKLVLYLTVFGEDKV